MSAGASPWSVSALMAEKAPAQTTTTEASARCAGACRRSRARVVSTSLGETTVGRVL